MKIGQRYLLALYPIYHNAYYFQIDLNPKIS